MITIQPKIESSTGEHFSVNSKVRSQAKTPARRRVEQNKKKRASALLLMLPVGAVTKQGLFYLFPDNETRYHMVRRGFLQKGIVREKDTSSKGTIFYYLTTKGIRYLADTNQNTAPWLKYIFFENEEMQISPWANLSSRSMYRYLCFQDAIAFFSSSGIHTIFSEIINTTKRGIAVMSEMAKTFEGGALLSPTEIIFSAMWNYSFANKIHDNDFLQSIAVNQNRMNPESSVLENPSDLNRPSILYGDIREENFYHRFLTGKEIKNPTDFRDINIGIFSTDYQDYSVYLSGKNGLKYSFLSAKNGHMYNMITAKYISNRNDRNPQVCCTSSIILCHTKEEMANAVFDKYKLRKKSYETLGDYYQHTYLVPMNEEGHRMIKNLTDINPYEWRSAKIAEMEDLADLFSDIEFQDGELIDLNTGLRCVNGIDMDVRSVYECVNLALSNDAAITMICEDWQKPYYEEMFRLWKSLNYDPGRENAAVELRAISINYEDD